MALKQFSKIFIFKNNAETRAAFGVNGDVAPGTTDIQFNGIYPNPNLDNFSDTFFENNLLHAMGVEEDGEGSGANGWNLEPVSSGKAYIFNGYLSAFIIENYDGSVETLTDLNLLDPEDYPNQTYVVLESNTAYTSDGTEWNINNPAIPFTFASPNPPLNVGDMLFYGNDPNNLRVAGKITAVYDSEDEEWLEGKRYKLSMDNDPDDIGLSNYQNIYYYRGDWNGKNIPVDITEGFYVLIGVENVGSQRVIYPHVFIGATSGTSADQITQPGTNNFSFTDLIRVKRISEKYKNDKDRPSENLEEQEIIPCSIKRTNSIKTIEIVDPVTKARVMTAFPSTNDFPYWVSYFVNPYGETSETLLKSSIYAIEVNEMLPSFTINNTAQNAVNYQLFLNKKV